MRLRSTNNDKLKSHFSICVVRRQWHAIVMIVLLMVIIQICVRNLTLISDHQKFVMVKNNSAADKTELNESLFQHTRLITSEHYTPIKNNLLHEPFHCETMISLYKKTNHFKRLKYFHERCLLNKTNNNIHNPELWM